MRLRFWVKQGFETLGIILGASGLYSFLMFIQTDSGLDGMLTLLPLSLLLFGGMLMMATTLGVYKLNVPLALSFGSTRNEALLGLQISRLIPIVVVPAITAVLTALTGRPATFQPSEVLVLGIGAFVLFSAVGSALGSVFTKYGKIAAIGSAICVFLIAFGGGLMVGFLEDGFALQAIFFSGKLPWLVLAVSLFFYSLAMIPENRIVWKCNVKL